jgi:two-component system, LytTR family, sensor kinase
MSFAQQIGYKSKEQLKKTYAIIFGITFATFVIRAIVFHQLGLQLNFYLYIVSIFGATIIWEILRTINLVLNRNFPYERNLMGRIIIQIALGAVAGLLLRALIYLFLESHLSFQLDYMFVAVTWLMFILLPAGINLGFFTAYFIERWKEGLVKAERLEKEKSIVQFDNLKNQLNPHFLFNALTSLNSLIREDAGLASKFLQHLSKIYRYVLQHKDQSLVTLQTEISFIKNYVFLAETRFASALKITFTVSESLMDRSIVPVTLQVLLENAFKHNVMDVHKPLHIEIFSEGEYLVIRNNLQKRKTVEGSNKQGLENIKSLYRFLTEKPLIAEESETHFTVKVPLL